MYSELVIKHDESDINSFLSWGRINTVSSCGTAVTPAMHCEIQMKRQSGINYFFLGKISISDHLGEQSLLLSGIWPTGVSLRSAYN